ncbi:VOC family protein [Pseudidiomarina sp.]|uniref:VOC family protein n=1 Tax=Pseudidiomarina sp. TaxID=2081707 RepID=UPI00299F2297|nr:VOC family protein [Pseudidiomarina sp.]MDX1706548.1 VOC family protein [Pseudidiomarina sp.]
MNTATNTINSNEHLTLVVSDIARSLDYYQGKLGFEVLSQSNECAQLRIAAGHVLNICQQSAVTASSGLRQRCLRLSQQGLQELLQYPQLLVRPFLAIRSHAGTKLPLQLQDPDGNRLGLCLDKQQAAESARTKISGGTGFRQGLVRVFSDLAAFHGYRR